MADETKRKRKRNPAHPAISLKAAVNRAEQLHKKDPNTAVAIAVAASHWGYKPASSGAFQTASALKQYGLLEEAKGGGDVRMVRLTDDALKIILDKREGSEGRLALLKEAALRPAVFRELWEKGGGQVASFETLRYYLVAERKKGLFYEEGAKGVIKNFRETISFAHLDSDAKIPDNSEEPPSEHDNSLIESGSPEDPNAAPQARDAPRDPGARSLTPSAGQISATITLFGDGDFSVMAPEKIAKANKALVIAWLRGMLGQLMEGGGGIEEKELDPDSDESTS